MPMMSGVDHEDIQELKREFREWHEHTIQLSTDKCHLEEQLKSTKLELQEQREKEKQHHQEMLSMKRIIENIQKTLHEHCNKDDENKELLSKLDLLEQEMATLEEKHREEMESVHQTMASMAKTHDTEVDSLKASMVLQAEELHQTHEKELIKKDEEIQNVLAEFADFKREKQSELVALKIEYDTKLINAQKQATKASQPTQKSAMNQDIYRKKLQHTRAEWECEKAGLKKTITELEQKLTTQDSNKNSYFSSSGLSAAKRRKF